MLFVVAVVNSSEWIYYCETPGCGNNVTDIFCDDLRLPFHHLFEECTGPPPVNTACLHNGRIFVSNNEAQICELEGDDGYIATKKCTGILFCSLKPFMSELLNCNHPYSTILKNVRSLSKSRTLSNPPAESAVVNKNALDEKSTTFSVGKMDIFSG